MTIWRVLFFQQVSSWIERTTRLNYHMIHDSTWRCEWKPSDLELLGHIWIFYVPFVRIDVVYGALSVIQSQIGIIFSLMLKRLTRSCFNSPRRSRSWILLSRMILSTPSRY